MECSVKQKIFDAPLLNKKLHWYSIRSGTHLNFCPPDRNIYRVVMIFIILYNNHFAEIRLKAKFRLNEIVLVKCSSACLDSHHVACIYWSYITASCRWRSIEIYLTHSGWDKMAAIFTDGILNAFPEWKCMNSNWDFAEYVPKCRINNVSSLVEIMAWRQWGDKPLSQPMSVCYPGSNGQVWNTGPS